MNSKQPKARRVFAYIGVHGLGASVEARERTAVAERGEAGMGAPVVLYEESGQRVISASPEALRRGVRPGDSRWEAQRRCPNVMTTAPDEAKYEYSVQRVVDICGDYAPEVWAHGEHGVRIGYGGEEMESGKRRVPALQGEGLGISLELTGTERLFGPARRIAQEIRNRLRVEIGVLVAVGLGPNRMVARLACESAQPGNAVEVHAEDAAEFVGKLPVFALPDLDAERIERLGQLGIRRVRDLAALPPAAVERALGEWGRRLWEVARGGDPDEGVAGRVGQSSGSRRTAGAMQQAEADPQIRAQAELHPPTEAKERIRAGLRMAAEEVTRGLREQGLAGRQIAVEIVFRDLRVVGARRTLRHPTRSSEVIFHAARDLIDKVKLNGRLVRRVRVRVGRLTMGPKGGQLALPLLEREARRERLAEMIEKARDRFGEAAVKRGSVMALMER